jgi:hypothetical protein
VPWENYLPVRARERNQPCILDLAFSMSSDEKKSAGLTLSTGKYRKYKAYLMEKDGE